MGKPLLLIRRGFLRVCRVDSTELLYHILFLFFLFLASNSFSIPFHIQGPFYFHGSDLFRVFSIQNHGHVAVISG